MGGLARLEKSSFQQRMMPQHYPNACHSVSLRLPKMSCCKADTVSWAYPSHCCHPAFITVAPSCIYSVCFWARGRGQGLSWGLWDVLTAKGHSWAVSIFGLTLKIWAADKRALRHILWEGEARHLMRRMKVRAVGQRILHSPMWQWWHHIAALWHLLCVDGGALSALRGRNKQLGQGQSINPC